MNATGMRAAAACSTSRGTPFRGYITGWARNCVWRSRVSARSRRTACGAQHRTLHSVTQRRGERGTPVPLSVGGITASRQCQKMRSGDRTYLQPIRRSALPSPHGVRRAAPNAALCDAAPRGTRHARAAECRRDHRIPPMPEDAIRRSHLPSADPAIGAPFAARRAASGVRQRDGREIACGDRAFLPVAAARRAARNFRLWEQVRYFVRAWRGAAGRPQRSATGAQYTLPSLTFTALSKAGVLRTAARQPLFASARA